MVDDNGKICSTLIKLKVLFGQLFEYTVINEIVTKDRNAVEYLNINDAGNPNKYDRKPFSNEEIDLSASHMIPIILVSVCLLPRKLILLL